MSAVVTDHFSPGIIRGGFVGIDMFFVDSGSSITADSIRELATPGTFE